MARQVVVGTDEKKMLGEILLRIRTLQNAFDENEIEEILRNPKYRRALREAEADIKAARQRSLGSFLKGLSKRV